VLRGETLDGLYFDGLWAAIASFFFKADAIVLIEGAESAPGIDSPFTFIVSARMPFYRKS